MHLQMNDQLVERYSAQFQRMRHPLYIVYLKLSEALQHDVLTNELAQEMQDDVYMFGEEKKQEAKMVRAVPKCDD